MFWRRISVAWSSSRSHGDYFLFILTLAMRQRLLNNAQKEMAKHLSQIILTLALALLWNIWIRLLNHNYELHFDRRKHSPDQTADPNVRPEPLNRLDMTQIGRTVITQNSKNDFPVDNERLGFFNKFWYIPSNGKVSKIDRRQRNSEPFSKWRHFIRTNMEGEISNSIGNDHVAL